MADLNHHAWGELDLASAARSFSKHSEQDEEPDLDQESGAHDGDCQKCVARRYAIHEQPRVWRSPFGKFIPSQKCFGSKAGARETPLPPAMVTACAVAAKTPSAAEPLKGRHQSPIYRRPDSVSGHFRKGTPHALQAHGWRPPCGITKAPSGWRLEVSDEGRGLPAGFDIDHSTGFGMQVVKAFVRRLNANMTVQTRPGYTMFQNKRQSDLVVWARAHTRSAKRHIVS